MRIGLSILSRDLVGLVFAKTKILFEFEYTDNVMLLSENSVKLQALMTI